MVSVSKARSRGYGDPMIARTCQVSTRASTAKPTINTMTPARSGRSIGRV